MKLLLALGKGTLDTASREGEHQRCGPVPIEHVIVGNNNFFNNLNSLLISNIQIQSYIGE